MARTGDPRASRLGRRRATRGDLLLAHCPATISVPLWISPPFRERRGSGTFPPCCFRPHANRYTGRTYSSHQDTGIRQPLDTHGSLAIRPTLEWRPPTSAPTHVPFLSSVRPSEQAEPDLPRPHECAYDGCSRAGRNQPVAKASRCDRLPLPGAAPHVLVSAGELKARVRARAAACCSTGTGHSGIVSGCRRCPFGLIAGFTPRRRVDAELDAILHTIL